MAPPEKRHPCTHIAVTRLYDPFGAFTCSICHKHPSLGWLYRCTQDFGGVLPESDFTGRPPLPKNNYSQDANLHTFGKSVSNAIAAGKYTREEVQTLYRQKAEVRAVVNLYSPSLDISRPTTGSTYSTASSSSFSDGDCTMSTLPQSTTFSTNSSTSLDEEIKRAYDWKELQRDWTSDPALTSAEPPPRPMPTPRLMALKPEDLLFRKNAPVIIDTRPCSFKVCPTCRPTYRERAMQSIDAIVSGAVPMPPSWELENRPVTDARMLANIGLPKLHPIRFYAQKDPTALRSSRTLPNINIEPPTPVEALDDTREAFWLAYNAGSGAQNGQNLGVDEDKANRSRKRSSFRESLRNVITRIRHEDDQAAPEQSARPEPQRAILPAL
jgi:hypothetical protein